MNASNYYLESKSDFDFDYNNVEVVSSCSLIWHGDFYIFGGSSKKTQMSKLSKDHCKLERVGTLSFDFYTGACTNFDG